jgi:hypothetical protein
MNIINSETYFTNKQLKKIIKLLNENYEPLTLVIYDDKQQVKKHFKKHIQSIFSFLPIYFRRWEGFLNPNTFTVNIFIFAQDGKKHSKQLYSLHALFHELRHIFQVRTNYKGNEEEDADDFATNFINKNSKTISQIMNWNDEWTVEED